MLLYVYLGESFNMLIPFLLAATTLVLPMGQRVQPHTNNAIVDKTITETYDPNFDLIGEYIVNAYINDLDTLESYANTTIRPANAVCYINSQGYMTDKNGNSFNELYSDVFSWYLKDKMIPIFYISDDATADNFIEFYKATARYDMGVMSTDSTLLKKVKDECPPLHMVLDYSNKQDSELVLKDMIATTNVCGANTVVVSPSFATYDNMFYFHARLKTVWINDQGVEDIEILRQITDGAYGSIVDDPVHTIDLIKVFSNKSLNKKYNYNRASMNIGHRGMCQTMWENSLEGCIGAYQHGATHIEIDIQVTKDKKLAIMHDDTIDRTTTGTGHISDYTAEELKQFKIDSTISVRMQGEGVAIPMLDEIFDYFKGKNLVVIVEIKTSDLDCVQLLKEYIEAAEIQDQVIVISFYTSQLLKMKNAIPEIPCADLNSYTEGGFMNAMQTLGSYNMSINTNSANYSAGFAHKLAERGYAAWFWTYDNIQILYDGMKKGVLGLTNNMPDALTLFPRKLSIEKEISLEGKDFDEIKIEAPYINYLNNKSTDNVEAVPLYVKADSTGKTAQVIFQAKYVSGSSTPKFNAVIFSDVITVHLVEPQPEPEPEVEPIPEEPTKKGCKGSLVGVGSLFLSTTSLFGVLMFMKKRRKDQ